MFPNLWVFKMTVRGMHDFLKFYSKGFVTTEY